MKGVANLLGHSAIAHRAPLENRVTRCATSKPLPSALSCAGTVQNELRPMFSLFSSRGVFQLYLQLLRVTCSAN